MKLLKPEFIRSDSRGCLVQFSTGAWEQANCLFINKNNYFGGHFHKFKRELFYLLDGKIKMIIEGTGLRHETELSTNDCFIVEPYEKHTLQAIENSTLVELLSEPFTEYDVYE